jgi:competence protein ComEC
VPLAVAATLGAWAARPAPVVPAAVVAVVALVTRRGWPAVAAVAVLAGGLADRAHDGLTPPPRAAVREVAVTLVDDPRPIGPGVAVTVRWSGRRLDAMAFGRPAASLRARAAGDVIVVDGEVAPLPARSRARAVPRHVSGELDVGVVRDWHPGPVVAEAANRVRRTLARGTRTMPPVEAALVRGFVIGDDRDEPAWLVAAFRDSGLAHLTAVSGQNVAFLLVVLGPLLRRLGLRARWLTTLGVVVWFAVVTRAEPSVLRACAMAGLAATARYTDRPADPLRLLAIAVAALTLVDPLLVHAAGWWLSVGATAGLAVLTTPFAARLPGPSWVAEPLAATLAAQLGVLPVQLAVFGTMPLLSVPANLLAGPAAGLVMVWGLPAGIVAGLGPRALAGALQLPTLVLVRWVELVAVLTARAPAAAGPVMGAVVAVVWLGSRAVRRRRRVGSGPP